MGGSATQEIQKLLSYVPAAATRVSGRRGPVDQAGSYIDFYMH